MTQLSVITINENEAIEFVSRQIAVIQQRMTADSSREWLEAMLCDHLRQGLIETLQVVEWADDGDEIADAALRRVYREMRDARLEPSVTLEAYAIKALGRGPVTRGRGAHSWFDDWRRNIGIAVLVYLTMQQFGLGPTRNREQRRRRQLSASYIVHAALGRHRMNVGEKRVENIWGSLGKQVIAFVINRMIER